MAQRNSEAVGEFERLAWKALTTIIAAGVIALFTVLYNFNARLARIETQLQYLIPKPLAQK